jgi:acetyltransferase-like isoleucine patch superfamily enzyme
MIASRQKQALYKEPLLKTLYKNDQSSIRKYEEFFLGDRHLSTLVKCELINLFVCSVSGGLGLLLRKWFYPCLFKKVGLGVLWGKNISLRHPVKISIGDRVAIDDDCVLDARGAGDQGVQIGNDVLIARGTIIQGKNSWIKVGNRCVIAGQCQLSSAGGICLGDAVQIAGHCYIGGGRYRIDRTDIPIMDQGMYSEGPVIIEDDVWLGAGVIVLDGVHIGKGCVIGAGAVIRENVPAYTIVTPYQRLLTFPRGQS